MHVLSALSKLMKSPLMFAVAIMMTINISVHADTGNDWLMAQFQANGSITTDTGIATAYQSTAETLRLWKANGDNKSIIPTAVQFLENNSHGGTEDLARLILARDDSGLNVVNQIDELKSRVNVDGGFGDLANSSSTVLDTAFALHALNSSGYGNV